MGVLKKLTSEYFGDTERKEDIIELPEGVERVDFTDRNGVRHRNGYRVKDDNNNTLQELVRKLVEKRGPECDLNDIDVSNMKNMSYMFYELWFNGDISGWDVSKAVDMSYMFSYSHFNGDISGWDVSKVEYMGHMFYWSKLFDGNLSKWKVSKVTDMSHMFDGSDFTGKNGDISGWDVSGVRDMSYMFYRSMFNGDLSEWKVSVLNTRMCMGMFDKSPLENNPPEWYEKSVPLLL